MPSLKYPQHEISDFTAEAVAETERKLNRR
jgi:hypothetical protein